MRSALTVFVLVCVASPAVATESLFAQLVDATSASNQHELTRLLSLETLSTSSGSVDADNRLSGGVMRHGVPAAELASKLNGCAVKQWRDTGSAQGKAYILWECPSKPFPGNDCYIYSYRAEMLDPRHHPANLFIYEMPSRIRGCGLMIPPPPRP